MAITDIKFPKNLTDKINTYYKDFYAGKIPIECDDDCSDDCSGHGNYDPNVVLTSIFDDSALTVDLK